MKSRLRFGWMQVVLGLVLIACAIALGGAAWILAWPAIAVLAVGLGYLGLGPGVFGKRADGSLELARAAILFPYHLVAWLRVRWDAFLRREDPWNLIAPGVYLGRIVYRPSDLPPAVRVIVDLTSEFAIPNAVREGRAYHCLPALDASVPDYDRFARLARALRDEPGPIYVHCAAGHGRSASFAAALLIARGLARDVGEAEASLRSSRPLVHLHRGQRAMVARFAGELEVARREDARASLLATQSGSAAPLAPARSAGLPPER